MTLILIGIIGGFLSGLFGIGGGYIYVPTAVFLLGKSQQVAQFISLAIMAPTSLLASYIYFKRNLVARDILPYIIIGGIVGAILGAATAGFIPSLLLRKFFGIFLIVSGIQQLLKPSK